MKEIVMALIEKCLGNDKILIVIAITLMGMYCAYMFGADGKEVVSNCVSGLLGMAIGQRLNPNPEAPK